MKQRSTKWSRRDKKREKKKHGMRVSGKSVFLLNFLSNFKKRRKK